MRRITSAGRPRSRDRQMDGNSRIGLVVGMATTSGGSTILSFFTETLPVLQWISVLVGIAAGVVTLILAIRKLREK